MEQKATIREVAALAGVSVSTVSRYLNDPTSIRPVAAYRVKEAIRELDYTPSAAAQNLRHGASPMIGIVVPHMRVFFEEVSAVVTDYFYERGYMTAVCISNAEDEKERFFVSHLLRQQVSGIMIAPCGQNTDYLRKMCDKHRHFVAIDRAEDIGCPQVLENHRENAFRLVSHLLASGHYTRLLFLHGWENSFSTRMCQTGGMAAVRDAAFPAERLQVCFTHSRREGTFEALRQFMDSLTPSDRPAIVAYGTDILEYTVMGLHQFYPSQTDRPRLAGFAIPGTREKLGIDCSLVIKNPRQVGAAAAELLYGMLQGTVQAENQSVRIPVSYDF